ncbi:cob(I)yrinic acid a,c-diamide adenosyltransferase [Portibacter lacus]|uniref:Corrinoid adenosyltransferase n=1 Tax=Portibacter lacus TaxID=1099794 RepID=A0AA37SLF7_9BACT|nr:cob(I)yrinic acid a,c-diamide adenosyltransferase [Portibacter lacus]GLR16247.1 ATP--cob(I)alamin adenosyltransferase [Portibacter lacus]
MKIYTKTGDAGETGLFGGKRVSKDSLRIEAYGTTDELNAFIGQLISSQDIQSVRSFLVKIQNEIFIMGSMLSMPSDQNFDIPIISESDIEDIEVEIDRMEKKLAPLKNFILPSGSAAISSSHICRTISRRAERRVVTLEQSEEINPLIKKYLNRLSDYFFVLSRYIAVETGVEETIWRPKK